MPPMDWRVRTACVWYANDDTMPARIMPDAHRAAAPPVKYMGTNSLPDILYSSGTANTLKASMLTPRCTADVCENVLVIIPMMRAAPRLRFQETTHAGDFRVDVQTVERSVHEPTVHKTAESLHLPQREHGQIGRRHAHRDPVDRVDAQHEHLRLRRIVGNKHRHPSSTRLLSQRPVSVLLQLLVEEELAEAVHQRLRERLLVRCGGRVHEGGELKCAA